jgi:transposase
MLTARRVTDAQVKELRVWLHRGASLKKAAMRAGMDRKSARTYRDLGLLPSQRRKPRSWRTRLDPLAVVWPELEEMLRREPGLQAVTLLGWLQAAYPGVYADSVRRTLERRVRSWKAQHGPAKEVYFAQVHEPGRLGASDFTYMNHLGVTVSGEPFPHLLYHFVLTYSNWEHVTVCFSESMASLSAGLQNALWALGGAPQRHRTDRMTLAVHADGRVERFTAPYRALLEHYGMDAEATNPASGHENGDCEQSHRRFKDALAQALLLRGSRDFASRAVYEEFLQQVATRRNDGRRERLTAELATLRLLPARRLESWERLRVRVRAGSTIQVRHNTYSVPARLIGEYVEVRLGVEEIEVWYAETLVERRPRLRGQNKHHIDYRHIITWLVRKPGAFARYAFRADLYPTTTFRQAYDVLQAQNPGRADRDYVQLLYLAAQEGESAVEAALVQLLNARVSLTVRAVRALLGQETPATVADQVRVPPVDLGQYDALLTAADGLVEGASPATTILETEEEHDVERDRGGDAVLARAAPADDARPVRGGSATSDCGDVELCRLPVGTGAARVPTAAGEPHPAVAQGIEAALGEELARFGPQASAAESGATVARLAERRLLGPSRERLGIRTTRLGKDALPGRGEPGVGASGSAGVVHDLRPAGARLIGGQTRLHAEGVPQASEPLGGAGAGRSGLCATEPGGDGSVVHAPGGALRARQRAGDEQLAVLEMGADLQGPHDDGSRGRSLGAPQRDHGTECAELSSRSGQTGQARARLGGGVMVAWRRAGCAPLALATLGLTALRQPAAAAFTPGGRGE